MRRILALDQGTTSSRAIVFDQEGSPLGVGQQEFEQIFSRAGWVEHDPEAIWSSQVDVIFGAMSEAKVRTEDLAAIGITNQRETTIVWDRATGEAVCNAIVWQDRRTAEMCDRLRTDRQEETFRRKTGLLLDSYFSGTKVAWILENVPGAREKAEAGQLAFGTVDSWLVYRLTDGALHITDASNASRTLLFNIHTGDWDDELLEILGVPRSMAPEVRSSSEIYAEAVEPDIIRGVPIAGIAGDQMAATMGQMCTEIGLAKNTYGTGCFLLMNTGGKARRSKSGLLTTVLWERGGKTNYALEGSVFIGGAIVQWLRDGLGLIEHSEDIEPLAASVEDSEGVVLVPALAGLGAPHWDSYARGAIFGLTRGSTAGHIARAALEGIAFEVSDLFTAMERDTGREIPELRADGGAAANDLLLQFQADILQVPVVRPTLLETTALGAAYLAGLAVGYWKSLDEIAAHWKVDRRFEPRMSVGEAEARRARWHDAIKRTKGWARAPTE